MDYENYEQRLLSENRPSGDPFKQPQLRLTEFDTLYNCLVADNTDVAATTDEDLIILTEFKAVLVNSYWVHSVSDLYALIIEMCSTTRTDQTFFQTLRADAQLFKLLAVISGFEDSTKYSLINNFGLGEKPEPDETYKRNARLYTSYMRTLEELSKFTKKRLESRNESRTEINQSAINSGLPISSIPEVLHKTFDKHVFGLISKLIKLDKRNRGMVGIQKILTMIFMQNQNLLKMIVLDISRSSHIESISPQNIPLNLLTLGDLQKVMRELSKLANQYIFLYQMKLPLIAENDKSSIEQVATEEPEVSSESLPFFSNLKVSFLNQKIKRYDQLRRYLENINDRGELEKLYLAPDGAIELHDLLLGEQQKNVGGTGILIINNNWEPVFLPCEFDTKYRKLAVEDFIISMGVYDYSDFLTCVLIINHHTPYTYSTPNSASQSDIILPQALQIFNKKCIINADADLVLSILTEPCCGWDSDVAMTSIVAETRLAEFKQTGEGSIQHVDLKYSLLKYIGSEAFNIIKAVECITDISIGCPIYPHPYFKKGAVLDFTRFGINPFIAEYFDSFDIWPEPLHSQAYNLLTTVLLKAMLFEEFYAKIKNQIRIDNPQACHSATYSAAHQMKRFCEQGFVEWIEVRFNKVRSASISPTDFINSMIDGRLEGKIIQTSMRGVPLNFVLADKSKSGPEVILHEVLNQLKEKANTNSTSMQVTKPPLILYLGQQGSDSTTTGISISITPGSDVLINGKVNKIQENAKWEMFISMTAVEALQRILSIIRAKAPTKVIQPILRGGTKDEGTIVTMQELNDFLEILIVNSNDFFAFLLDQKERALCHPLFLPKPVYMENALYYIRHLDSLYEMCNQPEALDELNALLSIISKHVLVQAFEEGKLDVLYSMLHWRMSLKNL